MAVCICSCVVGFALGSSVLDSCCGHRCRSDVIDSEVVSSWGAEFDVDKLIDENNTQVLSSLAAQENTSGYMSFVSGLGLLTCEVCVHITAAQEPSRPSTITMDALEEDEEEEEEDEEEDEEEEDYGPGLGAPASADAGMSVDHDGADEESEDEEGGKIVIAAPMVNKKNKKERAQVGLRLTVCWCLGCGSAKWGLFVPNCVVLVHSCPLSLNK